MPILIAIISIYINNSSATYSVRRSKVHECLLNIHNISKIHIFSYVKQSLNDLNKRELTRSLISLNVNHLSKQNNNFLNIFDNIELYLVDIKMHKCDRIYASHLLKMMYDNYFRPFHKFYKKWSKVNILINKSSHLSIKDALNKTFNGDPNTYMENMQSSVKNYDNDLKKFTEFLNFIDCKSLIMYELKKWFLGHTIQYESNKISHYYINRRKVKDLMKYYYYDYVGRNNSKNKG